MHPTLAGDLSRFPELLQSARDFAAREAVGLDERPAAVGGTAPGRAALPEEGVGAEAALGWFGERWAPGFSGSAGLTAQGRRRAVWKPVLTAVSPPSTTSVVPVIQAASREARKATAAAMSSGSPTRPSG